MFNPLLRLFWSTLLNNALNLLRMLTTVLGVHSAQQRLNL